MYSVLLDFTDNSIRSENFNSSHPFGSTTPSRNTLELNDRTISVTNT
jgi:hypothetical protein